MTAMDVDDNKKQIDKNSKGILWFFQPWKWNKKKINEKNKKLINNDRRNSGTFIMKEPSPIPPREEVENGSSRVQFVSAYPEKINSEEINNSKNPISSNENGTLKKNNESKYHFHLNLLDFLNY
jgi:hypothetical protein